MFFFFYKDKWFGTPPNSMEVVVAVHYFNEMEDLDLKLTE
jgi:hypothetical protein